MDLISLLVTLTLLAVTFWYAKTTKDMAKTARSAVGESVKATAAAERSAVAARDAATVAQSQIKAEFKGRAVAVDIADTGDHVASLLIESTGDAVVVQAVRINRAFRESSQSASGTTAAIRDVELSGTSPAFKLPKRLHTGERILMTHSGIQEQRIDPFYRYILEIDYTFTEDGEVGSTRELIIDA